MEAKDFQDDIPWILIDHSEDHYVLVFDLNSKQDATENWLRPEPVGKPLRLELNFTFPQEYVTELIVVGERLFLVEIDRFGVVGKNI